MHESRLLEAFVNEGGWGIVSPAFHKGRSSFPTLGIRTLNFKVVEIMVEKIQSKDCFIY